MKKLLCFLFTPFIFLYSCFPLLSYGIPQEEQAVEQLLQKLENQIEKKYQVKTIGTNVGMPRGIINLLGLEFKINRTLTKEEARKILVECTEIFLLKINEEKEMRSYLKNYPFTDKNIQITIYIYDGENKVYHPNINTASINRGCLNYTTSDKNQRYGYLTDDSEQYEEARKLLKIP